MNFLTSEFKTKFNTAPFSKIKMEDYKPAFIENIAKAKENVNEIINNSEAPTFENTIEALECVGESLDRLSYIFFNLNSTQACEEMQQIAQEVSPLLTEFGNDITLNESLFKRIETVYSKKDSLNLTVEQTTLLDKTFKSFYRNGALLSPIDKEKLRSIDTELSKLSLKYGKNVLAETNNYYLHITNEDDLNGLPDGAKEMARGIAKSKNLDGWVFTLSLSSYQPFVTYIKNRDLRKEITIAYVNGKWIKSAPNPTHENEFELDFTGIDERPDVGTFHVLNGKIHNEDGHAAIYADSSFGKGWFYKDVCYGYNNDFTIQTWKEKIKEIEKSFNG